MTDEHLEATISVRGVLISSDRRILVAKRASDGVWELPGGRLEHNECATEALEREIHEETSMTVIAGDPLQTHSWTNDRGNGRFAVYYCCRHNDGDVTLSEEHTAFRWLPHDEAREVLSPEATAAIRRAIRRRYRLSDHSLP